MRETWVRIPDAERHRLPQGHNLRNDPVPPFDDPGLIPAGSLHSTVADMLRFADACLSGDRLAAFAMPPRRRIGRRTAIGLCWHHTVMRKGVRVVWHTGGTMGFSTYIGLVPDRGFALVMLSNSRRFVGRQALLATERGARFGVKGS
jgi:CubicO group peptidase (beta-lactamase class C family)